MKSTIWNNNGNNYIQKEANFDNIYAFNSITDKCKKANLIKRAKVAETKNNQIDREIKFFNLPADTVGLYEESGNLTEYWNEQIKEEISKILGQ